MNGKIIIVDDEMHTRNTLRKMIETSQLRWRVVGEAVNGQQAVEVIQLLKPDLIISDIRMPVMDGIQLAAEIFNHRWDISVILLTAYKDFSYAQSALRYGVQDFLLKPCPEEEVIKVLHKAYEQFLFKSQQFEINKQNTLRAMILQLPYDSGSLDKVETNVIGSELWLVKVESYFPDSKKYRTTDLDLLQFAIRNIIEEIITLKLISGFMLHVQQNDYAVFLNGEKEAKASSICRKALFEEIKETMEQLMGIRLICLPYGIVESLEDLKKLPQEMEYVGAGLENKDHNRLLEVREYAETIQNEIISLFIMGDLTKLRQRLEAILKDIAMKNLQEAKLTSYAFKLAMQHILHKEMNDSYVPARENDVMGLFKLEDCSAVNDWINVKVEQFFDKLSTWTEEKNKNLIKQAKEFIDHNYMYMCKLGDVASHIHLSPKYFSDFFKQHTGVNFLEYLTRIRLEKARILLRNTGMTVAEIARDVGYDDPNYFSTVFKKKYQLTPLQFRKTQA